MKLPDALPRDIDYKKYISMAHDVLIGLGVEEAPLGYKGSIGSLFDED